MIRFFNLSIFLLICSSTVLFSQNSQTVFTVKNKPVTVDEFIYLYKKNNLQKPEEFTKEKIEQYLDLLINFKLKVTEAQSRGLDTTSAFKKEFNTYREELRKPYLPDAKLVDSLVALTYNRLKEEVRASHILILVKPDASPQDTLTAYNKLIAIRERALKGENFASLAEMNSEDQSAKYNKGDLGYFSALQMVYPFESAAFETPVGQISMPFRTRFGYHILKVNDRRPSSGEVEVAHILIRTGENKDNNQSKNKIFEIYDQLQNGASWQEVCSEFSEDPSSRENGGKLRPFGRGVMAGVPEFENVAFSLKEGEISDPFQTQYGWHIIKLERKIHVGDFNTLAPNLKNRVARDERIQVSKQALYTKLKKDNRFRENETLKTQLFALADSSLIKGKWNPDFKSSSQIIFEMGDKTFKAVDFINYVKKNQRVNRNAPSAYLSQLYNNFVEQKLNELIEKRIESSTPEFKWLLKEYYEGILLFEIMEKEVWNRASEDSLGQVKFFKANASKYQAGDRISGTLYSSTTKDHIQALFNLMNKDSSEVAALVDSLKIRRETGPFEKNDRMVLSKIEWKPGIYQSENNNLYYVVVVNKILPPGPKTFQEARPDVISDYQNHLEKEWIAQLKKKYSVKVDKKGKETVIKSLVNTTADKK